VQIGNQGAAALYLDPQKRLLLVRYHADRSADIEPISTERAVREFELDGVVSKLTHALERQLQGNTGKRVEEISRRVEYMRSVTILIKQGCKL
jgi:hypothetical protein